jgi:hypothetical protein
VGIVSRAMKSLENAFEPSSCAVSFEGVKYGILASSE